MSAVLASNDAPATADLESSLISAAREDAFKTGRPFLDVLEERYAAPSAQFVQALGISFGYRVLSMQELQASDPAWDLVSYTEAVRRECLVIRAADGKTAAAIADPFREDIARWANFAISESFEFVLVARGDLHTMLAQLEATLSARVDQDVMSSGNPLQGEAVEDISLLRISADINPIVRLVNSTIYDALKLQASDIHLESDADGLIFRYRIDGLLVSSGRVDGTLLGEQVVSRIKVLAELDIGERRIPQDGRFKVRVNGREIDFRVSVIPSIFGEDVVLRLLDRRALTEEAQALRLENLGLDGVAIESIRRLAKKPHGMLLVTGPTGSGKTTTLYAAITEINHGSDKIITIEDPVEYRLPRVLQIPVNEKKGLSFARGLRSILRHDPDKIMIGEIRDDDTAQIAVQAALTGHLVFTTVHANSVFDVLGRFLHMGVDSYSLASALNGIVSQRLVRVNCEACGQDVVPCESDLKDAELDHIDTSNWRFRAGTGCGACRGTGYKGRVAVAEALILTDTLRELIATRATVGKLKEEAELNAFLSLRQTVLQLVREGRSTIAELNRVSL